MKHFVTLFIALAGAAVCYLIGFNLGITLFIAFGVILELLFWVLAFRGGKSRRN